MLATLSAEHRHPCPDAAHQQLRGESETKYPLRVLLLIVCVDPLSDVCWEGIFFVTSVILLNISVFLVSEEWVCNAIFAGEKLVLLRYEPIYQTICHGREPSALRQPHGTRTEK